MDELIEQLKDDPQKLGLTVLGGVVVVVGLVSWFNPQAMQARRELRSQVPPEHWHIVADQLDMLLPWVDLHPGDEWVVAEIERLE